MIAAPLRATLAGGAAAVCSGAAAMAATMTIEPVTPVRDLACPPMLGGFERVLEDPDRCEYSGPDGALAAMRLTGPSDELPAPEGAFLDEAALPGGWRGRVYHLGETPAGDGRLERWSASSAGLSLQIELRYQIPLVDAAAARALVSEAGAANGVTPAAAEPVADGACAESLGGFSLEHALTPRMGGVSVLEGCAYIDGAMTALVYTARSADRAMEDFISMQPQDPVEAPGPSLAGATSHIVQGQGIVRGVWIAEGDGPVRVIEADWPDDQDAAAVERFLDAAWAAP